MVNKNYQSGRNFEYRVKKHLEQQGYYVMRSAGSKTAFDLIAIPTNDVFLTTPHVLLIQCKHGAKISKVERNEIELIEETLNDALDAKCIVAWSSSGGPIEFYGWHKYMFKGESKWLSILWIK